MSRVGILTYHNNENRGAILQAYALRELLESNYNIDAEVVEYRTRSKEYKRLRGLVLTKRFSEIPTRLRDRKIVERFFETQLGISDKSITTDNHNKATEWIKKQGYDALVTGSDEVWKITSNESNTLDSLVSPSRPFPNLYFLDPSISAVKFSYAASANRTNIDELSPDTVSLFKKHLKSYDHISVRDRHTKKLVEQFGIDQVTQVPDPTLMVDIPTRSVRSQLEERGVDLDKPILGFHGPDNSIFAQICKEYSNRGYQIITPRSSSFADVEFEGIVDPFEYYSLYKYFDMVVTNSLHSTIFSIKHGTPFVTIDTNRIYASIESKTHSLLNDFGLLERHINAVDGDATQFYELIDSLENDLDQSTIDRKLQTLQKKGHEYLEKVIMDI